MYTIGMNRLFDGLTKVERKIFSKLSSPSKIQTFLENIPFNFEQKGETLHSPVLVLEHESAHCMEGALFACAVMKYHGGEVYLLDMQPLSKDVGHAVALYKENGKWGAISKTNHAVLRYRDPVYASPRELVMSYFHEYFLDDGVKTLRSYTVFDLDNIEHAWVTDRENIFYIDSLLNNVKYIEILDEVPSGTLRKASKIEREIGKIVEWEKRKRPSHGKREKGAEG
jgi:hypothetical protein